MLQTHTIILWKKPEKEAMCFEDLAKKAFGIMSVFQEFDQEWRPNYLTGYKKNTGQMKWIYKEFMEVFKSGLNKEGGNIFEDLGYRVSFYSSLEEDNSFAHSLKIGSTSSWNVLTVSVAISMDLNDANNANKIAMLFQKLVERFEPFWGCVANSKIASKYGYFDKLNCVPLTMYWLNYFNQNTIELIGNDKIKDILSEYASVTLKDGILRFGDVPFDYEKIEDVKFHDEIHFRLISN